MSFKVEKYIEKEKETAKFKINILKSRFNKDDYSSEIIESEVRFLEYDFKKIAFKNLEECRRAISLFRRSFELFEQKYADKRFSINFQDIYSFLERNIKETNIEGDLIGDHIIPGVSNRNLYNKDGNPRSFVYKITMKQKLILNCLIKCFNNLEKYGLDYSYEDLDYFFSTIDENIYRYYNESFNILKATNLISNKEISKFKPLENAMCLSDEIVYAHKKMYLKLCMKHSGYEKISPLFLNIKNDNGTSINISHKFKVILQDNVYYKAVEVSSTNIDHANSYIIIASTRREMEDFNNLKSWLKFKINTIKDLFVK